MDTPKRRPGNLILDRYLPDADDETRERARDALRQFAMVLLGIGERLHVEQSTAPEPTEEDRRHNGSTPSGAEITS